MSSREHVLAALGGVIDPELDEPITSLRFVSSVDSTSDGDVEVLLPGCRHRSAPRTWHS